MSELSDYLQGFNLEFKWVFLRTHVEVQENRNPYGVMRWTRFKWEVSVNGEVFPFDTGSCKKVHDFPTGHRPDTKLYLYPAVLNGFGEYVWPELPQLADVVSCLVSDSSAEVESFADWCSNLGYNEDSRKALDTYLLCQNNGRRLRSALRGTGVDFNKLTELEH